ncbi:MAG: ABC transporter permease [Treponema sp.]|nr:ABC transporter permease [Treponema sp.]
MNEKLKTLFGIFVIPAASLFTLVILVFVFSETPARTLYFFFAGPFKNSFNFGNMLNISSLFIFGALGITIAVKAGSLNLGGEGQVYLGAFCAAAAAFVLHGFGIAGVLLSFAAGIFSAAAMASFSGICKARWNTNELITSFLLSCAVIPIVNYLVTGPFLDPQTSLLSTKKVAENMRLPLILKPSDLNYGSVIALFAVILSHFFLYRTKTGYEMRVTGSNALFARYGGINTKMNTILAMTISGGFYGLAGSAAVLGTYHSVIKEFSSGLGWSALTVALLSGFSVPAIIPAAIFFAWIEAGARIAMQNTGLTHEVASIVQTVIIFLSASMAIRNIFPRRAAG